MYCARAHKKKSRVQDAYTAPW